MTARGTDWTQDRRVQEALITLTAAVYAAPGGPRHLDMLFVLDENAGSLGVLLSPGSQIEKWREFTPDEGAEAAAYNRRLTAR